MMRVMPHCCTFSSSKLSQLPHFQRKTWELRPICAKKPNAGENPQTKESSFSFSNVRAPKAFIAKSTIVVFGLGFIDAGYSGDWSRIGVISKESEELLKVAAYLVIPLCLLGAYFINDEEKVM